MPRIKFQGRFLFFGPTPRGREVYQDCWGRISSYEVGKGIRRLLGSYNVEKRERVSKFIFPKLLRLLGRISSLEDRDGNSGGKNGGGEEY